MSDIQNEQAEAIRAAMAFKPERRLPESIMHLHRPTPPELVGTALALECEGTPVKYGYIGVFVGTTAVTWLEIDNDKLVESLSNDEYIGHDGATKRLSYNVMILRTDEHASLFLTPPVDSRDFR